ncbi:unnamed protein product [Protopolystoma xenopodis]|uniref:Uncharacterized protein n=1 Tax=Protopolystoma xenopodis TaxID=117903 RepID=A0A3S5BZW6_9PLAT|nr:unnamed protein product [Protopolystoma xenopodis]
MLNRWTRGAKCTPSNRTTERPGNRVIVQSAESTDSANWEGGRSQDSRRVWDAGQGGIAGGGRRLMGPFGAKLKRRREAGGLVRKPGEAWRTCVVRGR